MRAAKNSLTTETRRRSHKPGSRVSVSLWLILVCGVFAGLIHVPAASTQNRGRGTRPAQTPPVGPYVPPSSDEPPPNPWPKPSVAPQPQKAQVEKQRDEEVNEDEVVRINSSEVLLPVTVRDSSGALVTGLTRKDFKVFEDGREQPLSVLSLRQVPVDVALLVYASSSVAEIFEDFRRAA